MCKQVRVFQGIEPSCCFPEEGKRIDKQKFMNEEHFICKFVSLYVRKFVGQDRHRFDEGEGMVFLHEEFIISVM